MLKRSVCSLSANLCRSSPSPAFSFCTNAGGVCIGFSSLRQFSTRSCLLLQSANPSVKGLKYKPEDPRGEAQKPSPTSAATAAPTPASDLDRYPAIQQLRKFNFREGKEPYKIYVGNLSVQFRALKIFSISTTGMGLIAQPLIYQSLSEAGAGVAKAILAISPIFLFTYVTPVFIHFLAKRYVTEMFYDPVTDTYTGVYNNFFLARREFQFKLSDVIVPDVPGMFTTFLIKSAKQGGKPRPIFMMDICFSHLEHYGRLMKFDEPIDLHLEDDRGTINNKSQPK